MKRLLHLTLLFLLPLLAKAETSVVEIDFSAQGFTDQQVMPTFSVGDVTLTPFRGDRTADPKYYANYRSMIFYGSNYMTLTCATKAIERIEMTHSSIVPLDQDKVISDKGAIALTENFGAVWTNNYPVSELTITPRGMTIESGSGICKMKIYLTDRVNITNQVEAPNILPYEGQIFNDTFIVFDPPTEGSSVYYTTDGSTPKVGAAGTQLYTDPFTLSKTTVVQAIAVKEGMADSHVKGRGFELPIIVSSIAELHEKAVEGVWYTINSDMQVSYVLGSTCWIEDATGAISLYGDAITNSHPKRGYRLTSVTGRYNTNYRNPELEYVVGSRLSFKPDYAPDPIVLKAKEINENHINRHVLVRNARVQATDQYDFTLTDESGTIAIRNNYRVGIDQSLFDDDVDVDIIPAYYTNSIRYYIGAIRSSSGSGGSTIIEPEPEPEHDGRTPKTAYNVIEAISFGEENFKNNIWVKGYIVGSYASGANMFLDPTFGTENASDLGLILADTPSSTDPELFLRVMNISANVKTDLNLKDNPSQFNEFVAIKGMLGSNYAVLMNANQYEYVLPPLGAIENIAIDNSDEGEARYYNLQGMPVDVNALTPGHIYIKRTNKRATKFIAR